MRRGTLITVIVLLALLIAASVFQILAAKGPRRYPGPGFTSTPSPTLSAAP